MFELKRINSLDDYFIDWQARSEKGTFFYRFTGYNEAIGEFILKYFEVARVSGIIIEGRIQNPDEKNLSYYNEMMGSDFQMHMGFITAGLKKWLPRMNDYQRENVAIALYDVLDAMRRGGKNENILRNAYIKFMCWLYFKFERVVNQLGANKIPKILYEGDISNYELKLITILAKAGCDVVLLQYQGDQQYLQLDPAADLSYAWQEAGMQAFPPGFSIKSIRQEQTAQLKKQRLYGVMPQTTNATNVWISGKGLNDVLTDVHNRGADESFFYNAFIRINGVADKLTYVNDLYQFQLQLKHDQRNLVVLEKQIPPPDPDEIAGVRRGNYSDTEQLLMDLPRNIMNVANMELQRLMVKAFVDIIMEEGEKADNNIHKLTNKAVYLLCWLKRYQSRLFTNWKIPQIACLIYLGGCKTEVETLFLRLLSRLPVDVLILVPDLSANCLLADSKLYEITEPDSLAIAKFPLENADVQVGTAAYHAERELDSLMYQDSGVYRNMQHNKATAITLQTMYEEIAILWDQEVKYRPSFSIVNDMVNLPVIFAKVSGVKDGNSLKYWQDLKSLITKDTLVIKNTPLAVGTDMNPIKPYTAEFFKNGRLLKDRIKAHKAYTYDVLRGEMQDHILDKLQVLIEKKTIRGTLENGTEYTIIAVVLNLNKEIIRLIQSFDFTKKNPKLVYINTTERIISLEDSIITAFLNLIGFDILFAVPTGYQNVEKFFSSKVIEEHQIGDYMYDLQIPNFDSLTGTIRQNWRNKIFKRGR